MERIWLHNYSPGMPAEVATDDFTSLNELLLRSCQCHASLPAYTSMGASLSYAELARSSRDFAAYLQQSLGLKKGDRVALMLPNLLQYPVALFGALRAGFVVVNVNPQSTTAELEHQLTDSGAVAVLVLENFAHTLQQVLEQNLSLNLVVITTEVGDMLPVVKELLTNAVARFVRHKVPAWRIPNTTGFNAVLHAGRGQRLDEVPLTRGDTALLQYTGGTTGVARGAVLTHGNLLANVQQMSAWMAPSLQHGKEVFACPLPMHHAYALMNCLVFLTLGAQTLLIGNPGDIGSLIHDLKKHRFTAIIAVNSMYRALLDAPDFACLDKRALKLASAYGMAVQRSVAARWKQATGVPIIEGYGLAEASAVVISNPLNIVEWTGNIGMPVPSTEAVVLGDDDRPLAVGAVGEICVRGPQVMAGYWQRPEDTARAFTRDGWLRTGDMGCMDERGCFRIADRKNDMIIVSGFKVFPNQVEDVVAMHPGVAEVAAVGVADERSGQAVKVFVVKKSAALTAQALLAHCRQHLTGDKVPIFIEFRTEPLPKSALGKILRRELRTSAAPARAPAGTAPR